MREGIAYHVLLEPDPATDLRLFGSCVSHFISGDPGAGSDPYYRLELAERLIAEFRPGGEVPPDILIALADGFQDFVTGNWPDASIHRNFPVRGLVRDRAYQQRVDWLGELPSGECILIQDVCLGPKQYQNQAGVKLAELKAIAELLTTQRKTPVAAAFLHLPATATLIEVSL